MKKLGFALVLVACWPSQGSTPDAGLDAGADVSAQDVVSASDAAVESSTPDASTTTTLHVHYPAGSHAITVRGSGGGLSWSAGTPTSAASDVFTITFGKLAQTIELKPLLDDQTWSRGPNYHLAPGATLDIWPHFVATTGQVKPLIASFHSNVLGNDRAIYAYLPAGYDENTDATYPVVYMHDGQNLWAALPQIAFGATWNVDTTFDTATESGTCGGWGAQPLGTSPTLCNGDGDCTGKSCFTFPEAIVIGVENTSQRIYEYTPTTDPSTPGGGGADLYLKMLVTELKPLVDQQLRTRTDVASTSLAGSSLGGLVTAYAGLKYPNVFSRLGELSPSTWWNNDWIVPQVQATPQSPRPAIVYVDSGQGTADDEADTDLLAQAYVGLGYVDGTNFGHVVQPNAAHNEIYWAERLPGALQLMLGAR